MEKLRTAILLGVITYLAWWIVDTCIFWFNSEMWPTC